MLIISWLIRGELAVWLSLVLLFGIAGMHELAVFAVARVSKAAQPPRPSIRDCLKFRVPAAASLSFALFFPQTPPRWVISCSNPMRKLLSGRCKKDSGETIVTTAAPSPDVVRVQIVSKINIPKAEKGGSFGDSFSPYASWNSVLISDLGNEIKWTRMTSERRSIVFVNVHKIWQ